jgi:YD repeat-containing protein
MTGARPTDFKTGQVVSATYDAVRRPTAVTDTGGAIGTSDPGTTYAYSSLTTVGRTDPSGAYTFTFDAYGRETKMSNPIGSTGSDSYSWTYGPSGALIVRPGFDGDSGVPLVRWSRVSGNQATVSV